MENQPGFNLDAALEKWRDELIALPNLTPEIRRELEIHLCDIISEYQKDGRNDEEAFRLALARFGQPQQLVEEFKKAQPGHSIIRWIMLVIGWLAGGLILLCGIISLDLDWNFFRFSPKWNRHLIVDLGCVVVALTSIWFLAKANRNKANSVVSLFVCVLLVAFAAYDLHEDAHATGFFGGHRDVPLWYRVAKTGLLCLPGVFSACWARRYLFRQRDSAEEGKAAIE
jgi:hypothetical protein